MNERRAAAPAWRAMHATMRRLVRPRRIAPRPLPTFPQTYFLRNV